MVTIAAVARRRPLRARRPAAAAGGPAAAQVLAVAVAAGARRGHAALPRLVLGRINADFRVQIRIVQHFSRPTRESSSRKQICKF